MAKVRPAKLFFAAIESKGAQNFCKINPPKMPFLKKILTFKAKK